MPGIEMHATAVETDDLCEIRVPDIKIYKTENRASVIDFEYKPKPVYSFFKRFFDVFLSLVALVVLSPVLLITIAVIMLKDPGSPFFSQDRVGLNGKVFRIYKLRTMYKDAEARKSELMMKNECTGAFFKIKDDPRILGKVGKFLRRTSIDELPQLVNILKGDMSIIGPRPFVLYEQQNMTADRLLVKPGLSCYWQVNGKNSLSAEMSDYYDRKYIMERSLLVDLKIILQTVCIVFKSEND